MIKTATELLEKHDILIFATCEYSKLVEELETLLHDGHDFNVLIYEATREDSSGYFLVCSSVVATSRLYVLLADSPSFFLTGNPLNVEDYQIICRKKIPRFTTK